MRTIAGGIGGGLGLFLGALADRRRASCACTFRPESVARKLPGLQRVIETPSLAAVAYGEIASSIFFALGVVALDALGLTPWVLLAVGLLFVLVALSYAEGTTALPETGGAATFVRRAFNDQLGFLTGWVIFLDYVIVIALAAFFVPHYLGNAVGWNCAHDEPEGLRRRNRRDLREAARSLRPPAEPVPARDRDRRGHVRRPAAADRPRHADALLASTTSARAPTSGRRPRGRRSRSRSPSRCSPTRGSRRSRTWPQRRASRDARCREACSSASAPRSSSRS